MKYKEFTERTGDLSDFREERFSAFLGKGYAHVLLVLGVRLGNYFRPFEMEEDAEDIIKAIEELESRGAVRERDYILTCWEQGLFVTFALHAKSEFISREDFPNIKGLDDL